MLTWRHYFNSAADSLSACKYHLAEMRNAREYVVAYAHTKGMIFEAKSALDSIAAAVNSLFELGIITSHVFFNEEFIDRFSAQARSPNTKDRYLQPIPQPLCDALVVSDHYFARLRTYLSTSFALFEANDQTYLLSDIPGTFSFEPGIEAVQYCEQLLESVEYVFYFFNELIGDMLRAESRE